MVAVGHFQTWAIFKPEARHLWRPRQHSLQACTHEKNALTTERSSIMIHPARQYINTSGFHEWCASMHTFEVVTSKTHTQFVDGTWPFSVARCCWNVHFELRDILRRYSYFRFDNIFDLHWNVGVLSPSRRSGPFSTVGHFQTWSSSSLRTSTALFASLHTWKKCADNWAFLDNDSPS
jgi:hypothetical protein